MLEFQNDLDLFQAALGIQDPWFVSYREFDKEAGELHVHLNFKRGAAFPCPECHAKGNKVHDVVNDDRTWRHLNFFQYKTFIRARLPRVKCNSCKKILTVKVDWARTSAGFTFLFDSHAMSLMKEMPVAAVAREVKEHDTRLWRIFHYYVNRAMNALDFSHVKRIAVDETSSKRGHQYVSLFVDMDTKKVMFAMEGKGADVLRVLLGHLQEKGIDPSQIEEFCCDMSPAFIAGIEKNFPQSHITFDKFHVMKMVNEAVDQVRKEEQQEVPALKKTKYLWLKNKNKLKDRQKEDLVKLKDMNLKTGKAYRLKLALQDLWTIATLLADVYLREWVGWATRTRLEPMVKVAQSIKKHEDGILRWFQTKMTNGLLEGINSLVQAAKRKARGYRTINTYISMIYATANKLEMTVKPH
ncbi:ISL3 family transposase [Tepidibacillus decaturensis]|uniref:Transposase n=1 Tax=Tepidibacillus decaturensis TaxID=1413211 RepID=A0A135L417_9BACI|nr:ISL3 family transposase [Tepidibacillus decaturensis]KXG43745.1 transposase [Tepidibacillus decaturensis]